MYPGISVNVPPPDVTVTLKLAVLCVLTFATLIAFTMLVPETDDRTAVVFVDEMADPYILNSSGILSPKEPINLLRRCGYVVAFGYGYC